MSENTPETHPTPHPTPAIRHHKYVGVFVMIAAILVLLAVGVIYWPNLKKLQNGSQDLSQVVPPSPQASDLTVTPTPPPTAATTTPQGCASSNDIPGHYFGDRIVIFQNDEHFFCLSGERTPIISITAKAFGDSRCPANVQCIWAGEQTIDLAASGKGTTTLPEIIQLGTQRRTSARFTNYPVAVTLYSIDEGKGGTYAEILVEKQ